MDMYFRVGAFSCLQSAYCWYILSYARVDFVWRDERNDRLIMGLIDNYRQKLLAVAPDQLLEVENAALMVGRLYQIIHFQLDFDPNDYLRYEGYAFVRKEMVIKINPRTQFVLIQPEIAPLFPTHPVVSSIESLVRNERRRDLIDVVGKILGGGRYDRRIYVCEMIIQDRSGYAISLILYCNPQILPGWAARAIRDNWIVYASRCKLITRIGRMNYLTSTNLTRIEYNPEIPEAEAIRNLYR